jgi:hypothetical protein
MENVIDKSSIEIPKRLERRAYDYSLQARRTEYSKPHTMPYGTNFTRWVLPMFPAPNTFKITIKVLGTDTVYDIETDWSFSFL